MLVDKLTYASQNTLPHFDFFDSALVFEKVDICDYDGLVKIFAKYEPDAVMNLAAESHVDRSIRGSARFVKTNIVGTHNLLEVARAFWRSLPARKKGQFRFHHISTDEVFGDLGMHHQRFTEESPYRPNSPYAATKASADHLVRAWGNTYGLPVLITHSSNNYGPYAFPEKLIPMTITRALMGKSISLYGDGLQVRDWLYVDDHATALALVLEQGEPSQVYNIGGNTEKKNIEVVTEICEAIDDIVPPTKYGLSSYCELIKYVEDRPGHDQRYAVDTSKICRELGWAPSETFSTGISKTVMWYIANEDWWANTLAIDI